MNLRQKAKYYKKKYMQNKTNYYDRTLLPGQSIQVEQIIATQIIPAQNVHALGPSADDVISNILVNTMKKSIKSYMHITSIYDAPTNTYQFFCIRKSCKEGVNMECKLFLILLVLSIFAGFCWGKDS